MKIWLEVFLVLLALEPLSVSATEPFPSEEYFSKSGRYHIVLAPLLRGGMPDNGALILSDKKEKKDFSFSVEQVSLNFDHPNMVMSTAGLGWYRNSIAVFSDDEKTFVIKLLWPQYVVLNLENHSIVKEPAESILKEAEKLMANLALKWLDSADPYQRQTGAIVCKDLKISESIPRLKELLSDKEFYTKYAGKNKGIIVLYVRKAAKEALLALGESMDSIITELPEKDCLKFKDYKYEIDWENEKCTGRIEMEQCDVDKITFELNAIDKNGLIGTADGKTSVDYEFCIPYIDQYLKEIQTIDSQIVCYHGSGGRIGCSNSEYLCLGNSGYKNYRDILCKLSTLNYVKRIDRTYRE
ncbi:MAG: hypothetical protein AB1650_03515 [Candidatus Omnitrophota bacterium]